jgi:Family of unknown function (DUF6093)
MKTRVRIVWDEEGSADDTDFDYDTGLSTRPSDDASLRYDEDSIGLDGRSLAHTSGLGGKAIIGPVQATRSTGLQLAGGANFVSTPYEVILPLDSPSDIGIGAVVEVVWSEFPYSDPDLIDRQFVIRAAQGGTLSPARVFVAEEKVRGPV